MTDLPDTLLDKYFGLTERALGKARVAPPPKSHLHKVALDFLAMARAYHQDALDLRKKGDKARALGAVYYAHGWLDAGARLGLFDVDQDGELFTLAE